MNLSVCLSAMHLKDAFYIDSLNITTDAVVVNQCDEEGKTCIDRTLEDGRRQEITYICSKERGLSKSRNLAIENAASDIVILCDNDVEYEKDYEKKILDAYERHKDADLIVFYIKRRERLKPLSKKDRRLSHLLALKIFSPEISFRKKSIEGISFNEDFGAGAKYIMGEENIFLYECLRQHKKIYYVPERIASLRDEQSTWFTGYDENFFISRGANYRAMSKRFCLFLILQFAVRKRSLYRDRMTTAKALKKMLEGKREYESI
ncbi:MAG: glycosyltransferase family 2 protein, partial [Lachnospiraceae bacterium]|nr:glycosyltransferase family 2 protein [Lachnospiraceae bacterium]